MLGGQATLDTHRHVPVVDAALLLQSPAGPRRVPVRDTPVYIGSAEHCQIRLPPTDGRAPIEIVVWQRDGELLLRSLQRKVEIGGQEWTWAILEHGDQLRCDGLEIMVELRDVEETSIRLEVGRERRMTHRLEVDAPGRILDPTAKDASQAQVRVKNIGDGGGQIQMRYRPLVGQSLRLEFRPPPDDVGVLVTLVVIATKETGDALFPFVAHCRLAE